MSHIHHNEQTHAHPHHHDGHGVVKAVAASRTLSLLRMSATLRMAGAALIAALLWAATWAVMG